MSRVIRSTLAVLTLWLLAAGAVQALPSAPRPEAPHLFDVLREWAASRLASVLAAWEKAGSDMDPDGVPRPLPAAPGGINEAGGEMDPDG